MRWTAHKWWWLYKKHTCSLMNWKRMHWETQQWKRTNEMNRSKPLPRRLVLYGRWLHINISPSRFVLMVSQPLALYISSTQQTNARIMSQLICTNIVQIVAMFINIYYPRITYNVPSSLGCECECVCIGTTLQWFHFHFVSPPSFRFFLNEDNGRMKNWRIFPHKWLHAWDFFNVNHNHKSDMLYYICCR